MATIARWFGRTLAGWVVTVISISLIAESVAFSLADPAFYVDRLRNARVYETILDRAIAPSIESALDTPAGRASGLSERRVMSAARRALPSRWVYSQIETQLEGPLGYLAGERSGFTVRVSLRSRIPSIVSETRSLAVDADAQALILDALIAEPLSDAAAEMRSYGLDMDDARLRESLAAILAEEWLDALLAEAVNEIGPYVMGAADSFEIVIPLDQPLAAAESEVERFVAEVDWYDAALEGFVASYVDESLKDVDRTLGGFAVNRGDVLEIIRSSVTRDIAEPAIADTAAQLTRYFLGESDAVSVSVDLAEAKSRAAPQIGALGSQIANARALTVPVCDAEDAAVRTAIIFGVRTPDCIPPIEPARSLAQARLSAARAEISAAFVETILDPLPDRMTFTHEDVRAQVRANAGEGALRNIDAVRAAARDGFRYTNENFETDIARLYGASAVSGIQEARDFFQDGLRFNQRHMRTALGSQIGDLVDILRTWFPYARPATFGGIALGALMALLAGALIGGSARSRLMWACATIAIAGASTWALYGPLYGIFLENRIAAELRNAMQAGGAPSEIMGISTNIIGDIALDAISAILNRASIAGAIYFAVGGTLALLILVAKPRTPKPRQADSTQRRGG